MKCKHEWRLLTLAEFEQEWYYCIHCLARVSGNHELTLNREGKKFDIRKS